MGITLLVLMNYRRKLKAVFKNEVSGKIIKNSGWLVSDKIFGMIIGVFITAITARYFGPELFGQFNYVLALVSIFTALSTLGLETLTVKYIIEKDYDEGMVLCTSFFLRIIGGIILTITSASVIQLIEPNARELHFLVLIMSFTMVVKSFEVIEYWIRAHQKAKISSVIRILVYIFTAVLKLLVVYYSGNLIHLSLVYMVDGIITGIALVIVYFKIREEKSIWRVNLHYAAKILSKCWYLILSGLMVTLYMRIDQVMLGYLIQDRSEIGYFSAAVRIAEMWYFIPMAVITAFTPVIMNKKKTDQNGYIKSVQLLYSIMAWMGICFGIVILFLSKPIIEIIYGQEYLKAATILSISIWAGTFAMLGSARSIWLICEGLQKYTLIYTFGGLLINISLNILLIPHFGSHGAAISTLVSQFATSIIILVFFKKTRISSLMIVRSFYIIFYRRRKHTE